MIALRTYRNIFTNKIVGMRIVDENTLTFKDCSEKELKNMLGSVMNITLDKSGNIALKNTNPAKKRRAYNQTTTENGEQVQVYCIVTGYEDGLFGFIADTFNKNVIQAEYVTLDELAARLGVEVDRVVFINGYIEDNNLFVYTSNGNYNSYTIDKVKSIKESLEADWKVDIANIMPNGIILNEIEHRKGASKAVLPNGISHIEIFDGNVNHLIFSPSIRTLGKRCFAELDDLYSVTLNRGITTIPEECFEDCSIETIKFSGTEIEIKDRAFNDCFKLRGVLVTNAKIIGNDAFNETKFSSINLLRAEIIKNRAFSGNTKLKSLKLNDGLGIIGKSAFSYCTNLTEVIIPASVKLVDERAFMDCTKLKKIYISKNTKIEKDAIPNKTEVINIEG